MGKSDIVLQYVRSQFQTVHSETSISICTVILPYFVLQFHRKRVFSIAMYDCTVWLGTSGDREVESFLNEARVMKHLSAQACDFIIQLVGIQVGQAPAMIAMELATCGNFLNILKNSWMASEAYWLRANCCLDVYQLIYIGCISKFVIHEMWPC